MSITKDKILEALKEIYDPEIPFNIVDLGLVYDIDIQDGNVKVTMTLTAPGCPMSYFIVEMVKAQIKEKVPEVKNVEVEIVFDPPWTPDRMSPEARKLLGI